MSKPGKHFWEQVMKTPECWIWTGYTTKGGYGLITSNGKTTTAHRFAWELTYGRILRGMDILHHCDNPTCVRPDHLFLGTQQDNIIDMVEKGRYGQESHPRRPGGKHYLPFQSKLTKRQVEQIKVRLGYESGASLARRFGVTRQLVNLIKLGRIHLT